MITFNKSVYYKQLCRTCLSCLKKGMFCMQEGHVLERWRASSSPMKGVCSVREKRKFLTRGKGVREWRGFLSYRGVQMNRTHRISSLSQIYADYQSTQVSSLSQIYTDQQNTQGSMKMMAPPPSPPPKGRGVITEIPLWAGCRLLVAPYRYLR